MGGGKDNFGNGNNFEKPQKDLEKDKNSQSGFFNLLKRNSFWIGFLGTFLLMGTVVITYNLLVERGKKVEQRVAENRTLLSEKKALEHLKKEIFETLKENNEEILAKAWEDSQPQIKELERKKLLEVQKFIKNKLDTYFLKIEKTNTEHFLDKFCHYMEDPKVIRSITFLLKECKGNRISYCILNSHDNNIKHIEALIDEYLLNEEDLKKYIKENIESLMNRSLKNFVVVSLNIIRDNYEKEAKRVLQRELKNGINSQKRLKIIINQLIDWQKIQIRKFVFDRLWLHIWNMLPTAIAMIIDPHLLVKGNCYLIGKEAIPKELENVKNNIIFQLVEIYEKELLKMENLLKEIYKENIKLKDIIMSDIFSIDKNILYPG